MNYGTTSAAMHDNLLHANDFEEFLRDNEAGLLTQTLSEHLMMLLRRKGLKRADVVRDSGLEKSYVFQIFQGEKRPSRNKLIAIVFGLHLTVEEAQRMLKLGGCSELYARIERDAAILFALQNGMTVSEADDLLDSRGLPTVLAP